MKTITYEYIQQYKTDAGGWTKKQLNAIGVEWPPKKGWINEVCGKIITDENAITFENNQKSCG